MNTNALASSLAEIGGFLRLARASAAADIANATAQLLRATPTATLAAFVKRLASVKALADGTPRAAEAVELLSGLHRSLASTLKPAIAKDFATLARALAPHQQCSLADLTRALTLSASTPSTQRKKSSDAPVQSELVTMYCRRLEAALADAQTFSALLAQIQADKQMRKQEWTALAAMFAKIAARSKTDALKHIRGRHEALLVDRAKARASSGRVAG